MILNFIIYQAMEDHIEEIKTYIEWTLCILCQQKSKEPFEKSIKKYTHRHWSRWCLINTITHTQDKCIEYGSFPFTATLSQLYQGNGFEVSLQPNQGSLQPNQGSSHKSYLLKVNKTKLERIEKKEKLLSFQKIHQKIHEQTLEQVMPH